MLCLRKISNIVSNLKISMNLPFPAKDHFQTYLFNLVSYKENIKQRTKWKIYSCYISMMQIWNYLDIAVIFIIQLN